MSLADWRHQRSVRFRFFAERVRRRLVAPLQETQDRLRPTHGPRDVEPLARILGAVPAEILRRDEALWADLARDALDHRFDLLGSGPVIVRHGVAAPGFMGHRFSPSPEVEADPGGSWLRRRVNRANLADARRQWGLVTPGYVPIDWQLDFRSGHRWNERAWLRRVPITPARGADIKVPWELARMQHLPRLAYAYALAADGRPGFEPPETYARELRDQILDFLATNPPRFGVNWRCPMDVAIRAVNWLVARDLLLAAGASLDDEFERELAAGVRDHARHVRRFIEWSPMARGNHYLSDLAGLLFAGAYLPATEETEAWIEDAESELLCEAIEQFGHDGGGREASTGYHRLSGEILLWSHAISLLRPRDSRERRLQELAERAVAKALPGAGADPLLGRLRSVAEFALAVTKPDGRAPVVGDQDSGRFLKLDPEVRRNGGGWVEEHRDPRGLVAGVGRLIDRSDLLAAAGGPRPSTEILAPAAARASSRTVAAPLPPPAWLLAVEDFGAWRRFSARLDAVPAERRRRYRIRAPGGDLREGLVVRPLWEFGLWILASDRLWLAIRCGTLGDALRRGHAHNDALALELAVDGVDRIVDPGSFVYTALPDRRNEYRSVHAHFAPRLANGTEPSSLDDGLFTLEGDPEGRVRYCGPDGFAGEHTGYGAPMLRRVAVQADSITIDDAYEGEGELAALLEDREVDLEGLAAAWRPVPPSPAYGVLEGR